MKSSARKISLTPVDDLFSTEESRVDSNWEKVMEVSLANLHPFKNHPFKVQDDERMQDTAESIREYVDDENKLEHVFNVVHPEWKESIEANQAIAKFLMI